MKRPLTGLFTAWPMRTRGCNAWSSGHLPHTCRSSRHYRGDDAPVFAHESEREVAALLDAAGIPWLYEPRTFVLEKEEGAIVEGFTPDFYLPDADVYRECTAAKQSLTTRKNGKIRKLRARGEMVTVLYRRDMERVLRRYGRGRAAESLPIAEPRSR